MSKSEAKSVITCRYHMLECGVNFKGTQSETCSTCGVLDDEYHRLNNCVRYRNMNRYDRDDKINFRDVFSDDPVVLREIITEVTNVWNLRNANGTMNVE